MLLTQRVNASNNQQQSMSGSRRGQHTRNGSRSSAASADQCRGASIFAAAVTLALLQPGRLPTCTCRTHQTTWQRVAAGAASHTTPQPAFKDHMPL